MTDSQSTFESSIDFTKPMSFSADMSEHIDPSNLISSFQPSDIEWLNKDPFEILPWDLSGIDQPFNPFGEGNELLELDPRTSYATSNHGSPAGYRGYTVKTEDAMSDASPPSDLESETWSPVHSNDSKSGTQSPVDVIGSKPRSRYESELPPLSSEATKGNASTSIRNNNANTRKTSNTSSSSSPLSSPKMTASSRGSNKSVRSTLTSDPDAAAVMKRKKAAHNAIEKRYRTNMNAKFLALGNAIPRSGSLNGTQLASNKGPRKHSLCNARESISSSVSGRRQHEMQQQSQQQQQNKSEILTNALAYINELQDENSRLKSELLVLKENLLPGGNMMWRR